jgi:carboxyl-terminal processing protease
MYLTQRLFCIPLLALALAFPNAGMADTTAKEPDKKAGQPLPLDELRTFTEVFTKVKNDYVEKINDRQLIDNAIRGMLEGLDPHSAYLDKEAYSELQEGTSGEFGGLGIEVGMEDGLIKVISPIDDTPAQKAGIKAGDLIIKLNDTPVKGLSLNDAVQMMRGDPGTTITLTILREGLEKPLTIAVTRDVIKVKSVRKKTLEPGIGYLRISHFQTHTADDAQKAVTSLIEKNKKLNGLILDLRNNPGGVLSAAVGVSDLFLDKGLIVYTKGRIKDSQLSFKAKPVDMLDKAPIIVLVNGGSASASEIVAGALQDHKRALIMGQKTFGKGSVQTILPMTDGAALKLTTARYYTPSGRSIQNQGIIPDIPIENVKIQPLAENTGMIKEADLSGHLSNDTLKKQAGKQQADTEKVDKEESSLLRSDYALYEALTVLKGLILQRQHAGQG